jgi:hypothetical protein
MPALEIQFSGKPGGSPSCWATMPFIPIWLQRSTLARGWRRALAWLDRKKFMAPWCGLIGCAAWPRWGLLHRLAQMIKIKLSMRNWFSPRCLLWISALMATPKPQPSKLPIHFFRFSGATPAWVRAHSSIGSSAFAMVSGLPTAAVDVLGARVKTSPSKSNKRMRARCGWRR